MQSIIPLEEIVTRKGPTWSDKPALAGCAVGKCKMVPTCHSQGVGCVLDGSDIDQVLESDWLTDGLPETKSTQTSNYYGLVPGIDY